MTPVTTTATARPTSSVEPLGPLFIRHRRVAAEVCTLTVAWQVFDEPLVVAANRDERYDRPARAPSVLDVDAPDGGSARRVVAPIDREAGGTWIGYNDAGVVVALTNRWLPGGAAPDEGARSRGLLVRDALARPSAEAAIRYVERELVGRAYEGFYLLAADDGAALLVENDGGPRIHRLAPGVHVVMNVGFDANYRLPDEERLHEPARRQAESGRRLFERLRPEPGERADAWRDRAAGALGDHDVGVCIHDAGPGGGFGTRSSSLITVDGAGRGTYLFADGPPCETPYEPVDAGP